MKPLIGYMNREAPCTDYMVSGMEMAKVERKEMYSK
jgi:hypothetical protein